MAIQPRRPGIQRVSESEETRTITKESENLNKNGKFCRGCEKYFSYLKQSQAFCLHCQKRSDNIEK